MGKLGSLVVCVDVNPETNRYYWPRSCSAFFPLAFKCIKFQCFLQCCGSGSESGSICFWTSWIRIWIRILLSSSKNSKKNLDSYCFVTSFRLFIFEILCRCIPSKSNKQENFFLHQFFVGVLKVNDENSRIRIRIHLSEAWIRGSGSGFTPKCHGSATLVFLFNFVFETS